MDARTDSDLPLEGMLGEGPPEHGLRGQALIALVYACGAWVFALSLTVDNGRADSTGPMLLGVMAFAGCAFAAQSLRRFRCWAWFFVMGWLVLVFAPSLLLAAGDFPWPAPVSYAAGVMVIGWIHWLWTRRGDFLPDARIDALRRRQRWVTRDWRTARLTGLSAAVPSRPAAPVPGALWMRRSAAR